MHFAKQWEIGVPIKKLPKYYQGGPGEHHLICAQKYEFRVAGYVN